MMTCHSDRIKILTDRAKNNNTYTDDLDIGESAYLLGLISAINLYNQKIIDRDELSFRQKQLQSQLEIYYIHCELYEYHANIRNKYSPVLTDAEQNGCPLCKKLIRIFDGRDSN
jgi:hypothetical protein